MCESVTAMITTAFIERCLGVLMYAACRVIGIVERVSRKGPSGAIADQREDEYGCDKASQHWSKGLRRTGRKLVQMLAGFHSVNGFPLVFGREILSTLSSRKRPFFRTDPPPSRNFLKPRISGPENRFW
jgi:hypothetical protein